jgi:DNA-binding winged helix-turn-helix (wHTH) protein
VGALAAEQIFLFDDFRLDRRAGGLFRMDADGLAPIALGSRALDLLTLLVRRHGDLVSKDEIMTTVWPGVIVEDSNLPTQISALRRVVDKGRSSGSCIQTVPGRGYRFIASVSRCAVDDPEPTHALLNGRSPEPQPASISSAERRQLTVMISDLVGSTALAERLDTFCAAQAPERLALRPGSRRCLRPAPVIVFTRGQTMRCTAPRQRIFPAMILPRTDEPMQR